MEYGLWNDVLSYMKQDSVYRKYSHEKLTFPMMYAFSEHFILPLSHDEVVHLKNSLIGRMKGSYEEMFMQLRQLYMLQYAMPGKKLLFMGGEFRPFAGMELQNIDRLDAACYRAITRR